MVIWYRLFFGVFFTVTKDDSSVTPSVRDSSIHPAVDCSGLYFFTYFVLIQTKINVDSLIRLI